MKRKPTRVLLAADLAEDSNHGKRLESIARVVAGLAKPLGLKGDLVHVEDLSWFSTRPVPPYDVLFKKYVAKKKAQLTQAASRARITGKARYLEGPVVKRLIEETGRGSPYGLIALSTHGRRGVSRWILGSVADEVIRRSGVPVLTVNPFHRTAEKGGRTPVLFVPTALSDNSLRAEGYAADLAKRLRARIVLFHAVCDASEPMSQLIAAAPSSNYTMSEVARTLTQDRQRQLERRADRIRKRGVDVSTVLDTSTWSAGRAALKQIARLKPTLVIQGTHGRGSIEQAFFGRTAHDLVERSPAPVITVRSRSL